MGIQVKHVHGSARYCVSTPRAYDRYVARRPYVDPCRALHVVGKRVVCPSDIASRPAKQLPNSGVYVLSLSHGRVYVGKSGDIEERLRQHRAGVGAVCAKHFLRRIAPVTPPSADLESWERGETLARMYTQGVCKVRGWMYTSPEMDHVMREHAFGQICEKFDLCRRCGSEKHFVSACPNPVRRAPWFVGR
jgi:GIY-YIG catalytic domain